MYKHLSCFSIIYSSILGNSNTTLNKSPSTYSFSLPFISSIKLLAIDNPRPLPSVFLELSPLTKRSISSSLVILSGYLEIFLKVIVTSSFVSSRFTYTRELGSAYLQILFIKLSTTLHKCLPSALT